MLNLVDEAFNQVPFTIKVPVILALHAAILFRRDHSFDAFGCDRFDQGMRVIAFIRDQGLWLVIFNQRRCLRAVMTLAWRQEQAQR